MKTVDDDDKNFGIFSDDEERLYRRIVGKVKAFYITMLICGVITVVVQECTHKEEIRPKSTLEVPTPKP